ncbi:Uma2 family endonuclease [Fimbriiglobus ruber]|uniref:Putative restriction endonuclease domain-containing protein n=1 Tax=Fimbriiglobus ruber TaxID=1908690 RepID=A0A225D5L1_9BACT|nr:Uma2 family endonuclease [Fimbriiglobus ruber]OWK36253.1 hypothetical protein FRUB_08816 [Fimbriiglobus ruber]
MSQTEIRTGFDTIDDLLESLGGISPKRVRLFPSPGTATEEDVVRIHDTEDRLCELIDGTLVEKTMGAKESAVALELMVLIGMFSKQSGNLGLLLGADGTMQLMRGLVRIPDGSFTRWDRLPARKYPAEPVPNLVPDLAIEVISPSNTTREMDRKLDDYIQVGVRLVWYVDPATRTIRVYTGNTDPIELTEADTLDGGDVLLGFRVPVKQLFELL